jgi:hypothetical protein
VYWYRIAATMLMVVARRQKGSDKEEKGKKKKGFGGHVDFGSGKKWDSRAESLHVAGAKREI